MRSGRRQAAPVTPKVDVRSIHAEQNAILYAVKNKTSVEDATLYVTLSPCVPCARIIYKHGYPTRNLPELYAEHKGFAFRRRS